MATPVEDQAWYQRWHDAINDVIATRETRDREEPGSPAWDAAEAVYQAALTAYRAVAADIQ